VWHALVIFKQLQNFYTGGSLNSSIPPSIKDRHFTSLFTVIVLKATHIFC